MVLDTQRENVDPILTKVAKNIVNINPNSLTWLSLFFAFVAGLLFYFSNPENELVYWYLYGAVLFVFLNGFFDAIDGKVAKLAHKTSKRGDFLDHAIDRYADVFIVGGLALSPWLSSHQYIGFFAIVGMLLTSYMGTQAQAVGYQREYSGLLGRADRIVLLIFAPVVQILLIYITGSGLILRLYLLEWVLLYFAIVGNITAVQRFYCTLKYFRNDIKK
jgi:archaetidylinositol phosphate synthase